MTSFCEVLLRLRREKNLSHKVMGELLHISDRQYSNIEKGACIPNIEQLVIIADFFQVSTDYLLGKSENKTIIAFNFDDDTLKFSIDYMSLDEDSRTVVKGEIIKIKRFCDKANNQDTERNIPKTAT